MTRKSEIIVLSRSERLRESQRQPTSMSLPLAVHHRLDLMAEEASAVAATRAEIIGMLIAEGEMDAEVLEQAVLRYRKLTVGDVIPDQPAEPDEPESRVDNVVSITKRGPGRPSRPETG